MKQHQLKKIIGSVLLLFFSFSAFAQITVSDISDELEDSKQDIFDIINTIMAIICAAGVIYVASALIGKRDMSKGVVIGWLIAMALWGMSVPLLQN